MLHWREYEFCRRVASGEDAQVAMKFAFTISKKEARERHDALVARADIQAMLDFLTGDLGKYDDDTTRLVRLRQAAYELASNEELKPSERASMMKEYSRLSTEIKKAQAREVEANENIDSLLRDLKHVARKEVSAHDEAKDQDEEEQGEREGEVLGESLIHEVFR